MSPHIISIFTITLLFQIPCVLLCVHVPDLPYPKQTAINSGAMVVNVVVPDSPLRIILSFVKPAVDDDSYYYISFPEDGKSVLVPDISYRIAENYGTNSSNDLLAQTSSFSFARYHENLAQNVLIKGNRVITSDAPEFVNEFLDNGVGRYSRNFHHKVATMVRNTVKSNVRIKYAVKSATDGLELVLSGILSRQKGVSLVLNVYGYELTKEDVELLKSCFAEFTNHIDNIELAGIEKFDTVTGMIIKIIDSVNEVKVTLNDRSITFTSKCYCYPPLSPKISCLTELDTGIIENLTIKNYDWRPVDIATLILDWMEGRKLIHSLVIYRTPQIHFRRPNVWEEILAAIGCEERNNGTVTFNRDDDEAVLAVTYTPKKNRLEFKLKQH